MADTGPGYGVERPSDFGTSVARWDAELKASEKVTEQWRKDSKRISERYTLESRKGAGGGWYDDETLVGDFNILHSNVQTMMPAIFGQEPIPVVMRRHADRDPIGRLAAEILERALKTELEGDTFDVTMNSVTQDLLLCGRGVPWVRYVPDLVEVEGQETLAGAKTPIDYVLWTDFLHAPKANWSEVTNDGWVARRVSMTRDQGLQRFGEIFREVPLGEAGPGMERKELTDDEQEVIGRASVWEIWDMATRSVIWICRDYQDKVLDQREDPLSLENFFPCPMPAFGTMSNMKLVPTPDYLQYEKLANELDDQTQRISILTSALRVAGIYDQSMEGLGRLLADDETDKNVMIPVTNYAAIQNRGIDGVVQFLPLQAIAEALIGLYDARDRTKQVLYEVSGLSDIMRGQVDPREKLGQSRLKGQFASQRLQSKIKTIERCSRDALAIKAEIMAEHYPPDMLRNLSGFDFMPEVEQLREQQAAEQEAAQAQWEEQAMQAQQQGMPPPPPPQMPPDMVEEGFQQAVALLKDEKTRGFRIDIETNSTVLIDDDEEKQRRIEFIESSGNFLERALPVAMQVPQLAPLMMDMLMFSVRGFRAGRQLESAFEQAIEQLKQQAQQPPEEPQPDPAAEAQMQAAQQQMQLDQQKGQVEMAVTQAKAQGEIQTTQAQTQAKMIEAQGKIREAEAKAQGEREKAEIDQALTAAEIETKIMELDIEREKLTMQIEAQRQQALLGIATEAATPAPAQPGTGQ